MLQSSASPLHHFFWRFPIRSPCSLFFFAFLRHSLKCFSSGDKSSFSVDFFNLFAECELAFAESEFLLVLFVRSVFLEYWSVRVHPANYFALTSDITDFCFLSSRSIHDSQNSHLWLHSNVAWILFMRSLFLGRIC